MIEPRDKLLDGIFPSHKQRPKGLPYGHEVVMVAVKKRKNQVQEKIKLIFEALKESPGLTIPQISTKLHERCGSGMQASTISLLKKAYKLQIDTEGKSMRQIYKKVFGKEPFDNGYTQPKEGNPFRQPSKNVPTAKAAKKTTASEHVTFTEVKKLIVGYIKEEKVLKMLFESIGNEVKITTTKMTIEIGEELLS